MSTVKRLQTTAIAGRGPRDTFEEHNTRIMDERSTTDYVPCPHFTFQAKIKNLKSCFKGSLQLPMTRALGDSGCPHRRLQAHTHIHIELALMQTDYQLLSPKEAIPVTCSGKSMRIPFPMESPLTPCAEYKTFTKAGIRGLRKWLAW